MSWSFTTCAERRRARLALPPVVLPRLGGVGP